MEMKLLCLIILSCTDDSKQSREELERTIAALQKTNWKIERITLLEDRRSGL